MIERKITFDGRQRDLICEALIVLPGECAVARYVAPTTVKVGAAPVTVAPGTVSLAYYWLERPYNVYHWLRCARTLAVYGNVSETLEITRERVTFRDLALDVLVAATGDFELLDEDELPPDISAADRRLIDQALAELLTNPSALLVEIERATREILRMPAGPDRTT